jgi:hypothetical protein
MATAQGAAQALRDVPYPMNIAAAAAVAALGAAQIASISSTQFGGGATGLTSSGAGSGIPSMSNEMFKAPTVSASERNGSTVRIEIVGGDDSEIVRSIIKQARISNDQEDSLMFSSRSRQALELT